MNDDSAPWWSDPIADSSVVIGQDQQARTSTPAAEGEAPAVVAVVVVSEPQEHFEEVLQSLAAQDYPNLSVLVVYGGKSRPVANLVAEILPGAHIHQAPNQGNFSKAANQALDLVSGASFFLFCHDDVALDARCVTILVEELYRSNAGIVGPKLVNWADPRRLASIGMGSDRFGAPIDLVEPGEFDQEQYDAVRDVFFVPSGVQLVRADLFRTLDGFDPAIVHYGEALDLCWRAHVAGARVVAVPSARVRHKHHAAELNDEDDRRALLSRHRLRTILTTSSRFNLFKSVPLAIFLLLMETVYSIATGKRRRAADSVRAITWNLRRFKSLRQRRKTLRKARQLSDHEVREMQAPGSARIASFFRDRFGRGRIRGPVGSLRRVFGGRQGDLSPDAVAMVLGLVAVIGFGSRSLVTDGLAPVGQIPVLPGASELLGEWLGGWRTTGLGGAGNAPTAFLFFGLLELVLGWSPRLLNLVLVVGPVIVGAVGASKLARPFGSARTAGLASIAYAANPLVLSAMSAGRWDALVMWAGAPFLLGSLLRVLGISPFGRRNGPIGENVHSRELPTRLIRWGLLCAAIATFTPAVIPIALITVIGVLFGSLVRFQTKALGPIAFAGAVSVAAPAAMHAPFAYDALRRFSWEWIVGPGSPESATALLSDFVLFAPGAIVPRVMTAGILVAAAAGLGFAKGRRFDMAVIGWSVALVCWFATWAAARGWLGIELPAAELTLAPAAAGMALAIAAGARSVEVDLGGYRFGLRQLSAVVGALAMVAVALGGLVSAFDGGRWKLPVQSFANTTDRLAIAEAEGEQRVLWLGDPRILATETLTSAGGVTYSLTQSTSPDIRNRWIPGNYGLNSQVGKRLDLAVQGETVRLGRLLAIYGIDFVIVMPQLAPAPYQAPDNAPALTYGGDIEGALGNQLDLQLVNGTPDLIVYENEASLGPAVALVNADQADAETLAEQLDTDLTPGTRLELAPSAPNQWGGLSIAADGSTVLLAVTADGWKGGSDAIDVRPGFGGLAVASASADGPLVIERPTPGGRWLGLVAQAAIVGAGINLARRKREVT